MSKFKEFETLARVKDVRVAARTVDTAMSKIQPLEEAVDDGDDTPTVRTMRSLAGIDYRAMWTEAEGKKKPKPTMANRDYVSGHGNKSTASLAKGDNTGTGDEYEEPDEDDEYETDDDDDLEWDPDEDDEFDDEDDEDLDDEEDEEEDDEEDEEVVETASKKKCSAGGKACGCGCKPKSPLAERQKALPGLEFPGDAPVRKGAFKLSSKSLRMFDKETDIEGNPSRLLFKTQQRVLNDIPRDELPRLFGKSNMSDAQDLLAHRPRKAFQMFMQRAKMVSPKLHRMLTMSPTNASLYFYGIILRVSGKDMADIILKRFFHTQSDHPDAPMEDYEESITANMTSLLERRMRGGRRPKVRKAPSARRM